MSGIPIQAPTNPPPGTAAILSTLAVSVVVGVAGFIIFCIGRRWIRRFYVSLNCLLSSVFLFSVPLIGDLGAARYIWLHISRTEVHKRILLAHKNHHLFRERNVDFSWNW